MNFLKNKRGFSLIELMVVVAIMGILASIGIPQYLKYRDQAAYSTIDTELRTISRAFLTCVSAKQWGECTATLDQIGVGNYDYGQADVTMAFGHTAMSRQFCADIEREIGGQTYQACVEINAATGTANVETNRSECIDEAADNATRLLTFNPGDTECHTGNTLAAGATATMYACMAGMDTLNCGGPCGDTRKVGQECTAGDNAYCQAVNDATAYCGAAQTGECDDGVGGGTCT